MVILETLLSLFVAFGYIVLFVATALENIPVVGAFMPGEVIVVAAGFAASSGDFELPIVILIAGLGAFLGSNISYALGRWGGRSLIERIAARLRMDSGKLDKADKYFQTHGPVTVFVGRYMSGVKAFIPALAGAHHMPFGKFMFFSALGIVTWTLIAAYVGFYFGQNWEVLIGVFKAVGWVIPALIVLLIGSLWFLNRRRRSARKEADNE